jgi:plastocyanin
MLRYLLLAAIFAIVVPLAAACSCGSGGACQCAGGACACAGHASSPTNEIVALALGAPTTVHVQVDNFSFSADATIRVGDTVEWDWVNGAHTVTSVAGSAEQYDSGFLSSGSFSHTFTQAGMFTYFCELHGFDNGDGTASGMAAKVTVTPVPEVGLSGFATVITAGFLTRRRGRAHR